MRYNHSLSIIIPIYNEEKILSHTIKKLEKKIKNLCKDFEILLVENGSSDNSVILSKNLAFESNHIYTINLPNPNYGLALKTGFKKSKMDYAINFSVDWVDFDFLKKALQKIKNYDIIIASKMSKQSSDQRPLIRKFGGIIFHKIIKQLFSVPISDTHGLRLIRNKTVKNIIEKCSLDKEGFETEMLIRAHNENLQILEIPVKMGELRPSRSKILKRTFQALFQLIQIKLILKKYD